MGDGRPVSGRGLPADHPTGPPCLLHTIRSAVRQVHAQQGHSAPVTPHIQLAYGLIEEIRHHLSSELVSTAGAQREGLQRTSPIALHPPGVLPEWRSTKYKTFDIATQPKPPERGTGTAPCCSAVQVTSRPGPVKTKALPPRSIFDILPARGEVVEVAIDTFPWFVNDSTCARSRQDATSLGTQQQHQQEKQQYQDRDPAIPATQAPGEAKVAAVDGEKACGTGSTNTSPRSSPSVQGTTTAATSPGSHQCTEFQDQSQQQQQQQQVQGASHLMSPRRPESTTTGPSDNTRSPIQRLPGPGLPGARPAEQGRDQVTDRQAHTSSLRSGLGLQLPPISMGASDVRNILNPLDQHQSPALGLHRHSSMARGLDTPSVERPASVGSGLARSPADGVPARYSTGAMPSPSYPFPIQLPSPSTVRPEESTSPHTTSAAHQWQQQRQLPALSAPNTPHQSGPTSLPPSREMGPDRTQRSFSLAGGPMSGNRPIESEQQQQHTLPALSPSWGPGPGISPLGVPRRPSPAGGPSVRHGASPFDNRTPSQPPNRQGLPPLATDQLNPPTKRSRDDSESDTSNLYRGSSEETSGLPGQSRGTSLYNQMLRRGGEPRQSMVLIPQGGGQIECTVDLKQGSIAADEKRRRNAEASKRFRERKKDHNLQTDQELRESQRQNSALIHERDYWREEYRRVLSMMPPAMRHEAERTAPPMPQHPSESSGDDHGHSPISQQQGGSQRAGRGSGSGRGRGRRQANPQSFMSSQTPQGRQSEGGSPAYSDMSSVGQEPAARRRRTDDYGNYMAYGTPSQSPQAPAHILPHGHSGTATPSPRPVSNGGPPPPAGPPHPSLPPLNPGPGFLPPPGSMSYRGPAHPGLPAGTPPAAHSPQPHPMHHLPGQPPYPPMSRPPVETRWATGPSG
ncbi:hypothetical protein PoMZ_04302 [Pyricularia oryzae]|uniref:BZIP domain-containing protein n=1 Tax=Pyricularia oryzae TaxID=318829 RepID=A0A4P7NCA7_PYROR|nr:hypothetical protein PoMZ_04302 [Pyricularia oryzae]